MEMELPSGREVHLHGVEAAKQIAGRISWLGAIRQTKSGVAFVWAAIKLAASRKARPIQINGRFGMRLTPL